MNNEHKLYLSKSPRKELCGDVGRETWLVGSWLDRLADRRPDRLAGNRLDRLFREGDPDTNPKCVNEHH